MSASTSRWVWTTRKSGPRLREVFEGGPADRAGVKNNDLIELIDGVDTKGMLLREAVDRLRGEEGTDVTIKVRQPKTTDSRTYTITRGQHARATVRGPQAAGRRLGLYRLDASAPIGYLRINEIAASTPHELRKLARQLENQGSLGRRARSARRDRAVGPSGRLAGRYACWTAARSGASGPSSAR